MQLENSFGVPGNFNFWGKRSAIRSTIQAQSAQSCEY